MSASLYISQHSFCQVNLLNYLKDTSLKFHKPQLHCKLPLLHQKCWCFSFAYSSCHNLTSVISRVLIGPCLNFCSLTSPTCCENVHLEYVCVENVYQLMKSGVKRGIWICYIHNLFAKDFPYRKGKIFLRVGQYWNLLFLFVRATTRSWWNHLIAFVYLPIKVFYIDPLKFIFLFVFSFPKPVDNCCCW